MATRRRSPSNQNIMSHYKPDFDLQTSESVLKCLLYSFFEVSWQLLRVEASAKSERNEKRASINAPLRLITSGGEIRIALKKNSGGWFKFQVFFKSFFPDGSVVHARILTKLDEILWVATLPQLRSALAFYSYVLSLARTSSGSVSPVLLGYNTS